MLEDIRRNRQERTILMRTALVAIACNEDHYLREWFSYHHTIGFDDIYVYQNNWHFKEEVPGYVHLIDFPGMC